MSSSIVTMIAARPPLPASRAAPDAPNAVVSHGEQLTKKVKRVVASWEWMYLGEDKIGIVIPVDQDHRDVAKSRFVDLLEFCEETLKVREVYAVFGRADLTVSAGFPRTLRYIGFRVVAPEHFPDQLDASTHFAMTYVI